jgi:RND family efflux transporter MFP subunit
MSEMKPALGPEIELLRIPRKDAIGAPRRKKRGFGWFFGWFIVIALAALAVYLLWNRVAPVLSRWRAPLVSTGTAVKTRPGASNELTTANGYVVARTKAAVSSKLSGRLVDLRVDVGSRVKKGDLLGKIEEDIYRAAADHAEAEVAEAKAEEVAAGVRVSIAERAVEKAGTTRDEMTSMIKQWRVELAEAERVVTREEELLKREAGTPEAVAQAKYKRDLIKANIERAESQVRTTEAGVKEAEAEVFGQKARVLVAKEATKRAQAMLATARSNLADTELKAPFDGVVLRKEADVGEMVVPALMGGGSTRGSVVTLADFSSLEIEVDVFERDVHYIKEGGPAQIILDAYSDDRMDGHVRQIEPTADRQKATIMVKVTFDKLDERVLPEMGGRVVFLRPGSESVPLPEVIAPSSAVVTRGGVRGIFVIEEDRSRFVPVETGDTRPGGIVIVRGLSGGELVIVDPKSEISDGIVVRRE